MDGETRAPAAYDDDRLRRTVEALLFGSYGKQIRYAALSLDGNGLNSYGECAMEINSEYIQDRSSLLESNSFDFAQKLNLLNRAYDDNEKEKIPFGYVSTWRDKHKLSVAKLGDKINSNTTKTEFAKILLRTTKDRKTDEFIEVHIYGPISSNKPSSR